MKILTLVIIREGSRVLLGMKKRGFGEGKWNGFGGKVEIGETIEGAAKRELREECGIHASQLENRGVLQFFFEGESDDLEVHLFFSEAYEGEPVETDEMRPQWFESHEIPFEDMWPDDRYWLPHLLDGKSVKGEFWFKGEEIIKHHLELPAHI